MNRQALGFLFVFLTISCLFFFSSSFSALLSFRTHVAAPAAAQTDVDPDILDSEFNHRVAGYALFLMSLLIFAGYASPRLAFLQYVWPLIFTAVGIFLAIWSDKEVWPRGQLNLWWLLDHDPEARQHKIYAVLLIAMGIFELQRARGKLGPFWRRWSFPLLAVFGAIFLLFHAHGGGTGLPLGWDNAEKQAKIAEMRRKSGLPERPPAYTAAPPAGVNKDISMHDPGAMEHDMQHMTQASQASPSAQQDHEGMGHAGHQMTPEMLHIKREHVLYTIAGLAIALFKFIADGNFFRSRIIPYLWPGAMGFLGMLLTTYTE